MRERQWNHEIDALNGVHHMIMMAAGGHDQADDERLSIARRSAPNLRVLQKYHASITIHSLSPDGSKSLWRMSMPVGCGSYYCSQVRCKCLRWVVSCQLVRFLNASLCSRCVCVCTHHRQRSAQSWANEDDRYTERGRKSWSDTLGGCRMSRVPLHHHRHHHHRFKHRALWILSFSYPHSHTHDYGINRSSGRILGI